MSHFFLVAIDLILFKLTDKGKRIEYLDVFEFWPDLTTATLWQKSNLTISAVSLEIFVFLFTDIFIGKSCTFHMNFVQIA